MLNCLEQLHKTWRDCNRGVRGRLHVSITWTRIGKREITVVFFLDSTCGKADNSGAVYRSNLTETNKKILSFDVLVPQKLLKAVGSKLLQFYVLLYRNGHISFSDLFLVSFREFNTSGISKFPSNILGQLMISCSKFIQTKTHWQL